MKVPDPAPRPEAPASTPFWREPLGLDLLHASLRPGRRELELRFRFGQVYRVDLGLLGFTAPAAYALLGAGPRAVLLGLAGGDSVDLDSGRLLAAVEPAYREEAAANAAAGGSVGARVRTLRREAGLMAKEVAAAAGMAASNYARLEAGLHEPRVATLRRVAAALGVPVGALFGQAS